MDQISNVATQADYTDLLTLGPSNYDAICVNVWNNSCVSQTFELGPGGDYQTGQWGSESPETANSTFQLANCGGVRFKTNPDTPGTPARIIAYAWKSGDVQKLGGIQLSGAIGAAGNVNFSSGVIFGFILGATGAIISGTGFTSARTGAGVYAITYTTPFTNYSIPVWQVDDIATTNRSALTALSAAGFTVAVVDSTGVAFDPAGVVFSVGGA